MKKFRKIWDAEKNAWLTARKDADRRELYRMFLAAFPDASDVTETAFNNQRSRIGAVIRRQKHPSTKPRPLYSEQLKKGYVRIKVAQPNKWILKSAWVYMETHPWEDFSERSCYIFLDGDNRNFSPANIERVPLRLMGIFARLGGTEPGQPEVTRTRVAQARLKAAVLDAGERLGLTVRQGSCRKFREERNLKARLYTREMRRDPEKYKRHKEAVRKRLEQIKAEDPERWAEMAEARKKTAHEWYLRNKARISEKRKSRRAKGGGL